ncbi:hypothetical protein AAFC00_002419 [Neodothiora populina]|uniref:SAC domain-containing protein n=1 Tax=Neodothiora populina TaxID=2781224 RepID=A0ABR3P711_9PEZI
MSSVLPFRDINVHASPEHYAFSSPSNPSAPTLVIDRPSGDIRLNDGKLLGGQRVTSIQGIMGIISLRLDKYIVVITKAQPMGRIKGHMVYRIVATEMLPLRERQVHDPDEDTYLLLVKSLLHNGPMYFSYTFDLTNSFQRQAVSNEIGPLWQRADDRFFWNRFIQSDLIKFRLGQTNSRTSQGPQQAVDPYILPVMFGMLRITNTSVKGTPLTFILITRRSRHRAGTRYFSRGLDDQGHVSNFNETEQTVILNDDSSSGMTTFAGDGGFSNSKPRGQETQVLSYVQTRGSVPVYWAEVNTLKYTPKLQVRGIDTAVDAAKLHFDEQIHLYGDNWLVNLVNQKGREQRVKEAYEEMVKKLVDSPAERSQSDRMTREKFTVIDPSEQKHEFDKLHYIYFDFHSETKGLKWHRAELLLEQLKEGLMKGEYFHGVDAPGGRIDIIKKQSAIVRTNCMDCLDRTNVVQSMLGRFTLSRMLTDLGVLRPGQKAQEDESFEHLFRNVWADNADVVSRSYSGTGALKTDFTRTGKRTRAGALQDLNNSITRYIRNNFSDGPRQDGFDVFLGAYIPDPSGFGSAHQFADTRPVSIQAVPYVLCACLFFLFITLFTRRMPDATVWPLRIFTLLCVITAAWTARFMATNGALYVNWPKLNTPAHATESYQDALDRVSSDPVLGAFIPKHSRGRSNTNLGYMEEGKKRIE